MRPGENQTIKTTPAERSKQKNGAKTTPQTAARNNRTELQLRRVCGTKTGSTTRLKKKNKAKTAWTAWKSRRYSRLKTHELTPTSILPRACHTTEVTVQPAPSTQRWPFNIPFNSIISQEYVTLNTEAQGYFPLLRPSVQVHEVIGHLTSPELNWSCLVCVTCGLRNSIFLSPFILYDFTIRHSSTQRPPTNIGKVQPKPGFSETIWWTKVYQWAKRKLQERRQTLDNVVADWSRQMVAVLRWNMNKI